MLIYNQRPHRSLSLFAPKEIHRRDGSTLDTFLKINSNEGGREVKKKKISGCDIVRINQNINVFEEGKYLWSTELFKVSRVLDTTPIAYLLRDMKDDEFLAVFMIMNYKSQKYLNVSDSGDIKESY